MLREYDFTIITSGNLPEGENAKALAGYEALMAKDGGEILKREDWGSKKMNYPIKKVFRGFYTNYDFVGTPDNVAEMERLIRIDDNVLRHLIVRTDDQEGQIDISARKVELAKKEKEAREHEAEQRRRKE